MIVGYTKFWSQREKADTGFEITNEIFRLFLSILLLSGCQKLRDCKMYWETPPETFVQAMFDLIPRNTFESILISIFVKTNNSINKTNSRSSFPWLMS